ncbi:type IV toxin-antitoxin system AbiEi family antitoxin domain-containing protein [Mycoplasmatota bacterium]|nr:type IV toxin-antitoxin system AbiEi family antitoxin domain-containing protein [Mycoplasmatota bacterium]
MSVKELVFKLMKKNNGIIESKEAKEAGIDNKVLQRLTQTGEIERVGRGIYIDANYIQDEYLVTQYRCKKGIYSHETALFIHDLCDRIPFQLMLTIPSGYNTRLLKDKYKYKFFYSNKKLYEIGKMNLKSPHGNEIIVYNKERTICDCLRKKDKLDSDLVITAVKQYMNELGADYSRLLTYAEIFNVRELVRQYMEVLS